MISADDHVICADYHVISVAPRMMSGYHTNAAVRLLGTGPDGGGHVTSAADHVISGSDHYKTSGAGHVISGADHVIPGEDHVIWYGHVLSAAVVHHTTESDRPPTVPHGTGYRHETHP